MSVLLGSVAPTVTLHAAVTPIDVVNEKVVPFAGVAVFLIVRNASRGMNTQSDGSEPGIFDG